jgi:hypothetical protein
MAIRFTIDSSRHIAFISFDGQLACADVDRTLDKFRAKGGMGCRRLLDFSRVRVTFDIDTVKAICSRVALSMTTEPVALVAGTDLAREVCETIARLAKHDQPLKIFDRPAEATTWLLAAQDLPAAHAAAQ